VKTAVGILVLLVMAAGHAAAAPAEERLTLKRAISMALEKNQLIKAAGFGVKAAQQRLDIAGSRYYPELFFDETLTASNSPTQSFMMKLDEGRFSQDDFRIDNLNHPAAWHDFKTALTLRQPLYLPSVSPAREMAEKDAQREAYGADGTRQEVSFLIFRLFLEVHKSGAQVKSASLAVSEAREHMRLAGVRREEGTGLRSDELRARTHLSSAQQQVITALNNLTLAKMKLADTIGLEDGANLEISEEPPTTRSIAYTSAELVGMALENRSELKQTQAELAKLDAALKLARNAWHPTIDAFASYQLNAKDAPFGNDNDSWMAGLSLRWQIFDGFRRNRELDRASALRSSTAEILGNSSKEIIFQVRESLLRREEMGKRLEVARHALLDAEESVRLLDKRFENSLATMAELLDAQTALNQARSNLVENETNYALASGRVYYSAGIFLKEMLK
jgi:outer membrane protein TolC